MNISQKGVLARSKPETWSDGATKQINLDFLVPYMKRMAAPVVRELKFELTLSGTGTTGGHNGEDAYKAFKRITLRDSGGVYYDLPGTIIRQVEQLEVGSCQNEPDALSSGTADSSYKVTARLIFDTEKSHRGADTAVELLRFVSGGEVSVQFGTPPAMAVESGTLRVYAVIHDERVREVKSRMVWTERSITATEDDYKVNGSLRAAFITSALTTAGYTDLSGLTETDSRVLEHSDLDTDLLRDEYRRTSRDRASDDEFLAATPGALPLLVPSKGQHIGKMPDVQSFDVKIGSTPASGRMVTCKIEDRYAPLAAEWLGYVTVNDYLVALRKRGEVANKGGGRSAVSAWSAHLLKRLPLRIPRI